MKHFAAPLFLVITLFSCSAPEPKRTQPEFPDFYFEDPDRISKISALFPEVDSFYHELALDEHIPALAYGIVVDDSLIFSGATGILNQQSKKPATVKSYFRIASMTKSFTAMAILKLRDEGKLSLNDLVSGYFPELVSSELPYLDAPDVTIHHLLTMTAGFPEDNPWGDRQLEDTEQEFKDFLKSGVSFSSMPGYQFEYSNLGYGMLGQIVSRVSGMPYQTYIKNEIFSPLGMNDTYWEYDEVPKENLAIGYRYQDSVWMEEPILHDGVYGAMGGLITTIEDFSKYVRFHLKAWPPSNIPESGPVKRSTLREMHQPFMPRLFPDAKRLDGSNCPVLVGYGYGLGYRRDCDQLIRISHSGGLPGYGSEYRFYPELGVGIICFGNLTYAGHPNNEVMRLLLTKADLKPRVLRVSEILNTRKAQVLQLLENWNLQDTTWIAENFFLDFDRDYRKKEWDGLVAQAGNVISVGEINPENALRGTFEMKTAKGIISVFFTLSPEKPARLQMLEATFVPTAPL